MSTNMSVPMSAHVSFCTLVFAHICATSACTVGCHIHARCLVALLFYLRLQDRRRDLRQEHHDVGRPPDREPESAAAQARHVVEKADRPRTLSCQSNIYGYRHVGRYSYRIRGKTTCIVMAYLVMALVAKPSGTIQYPWHEGLSPPPVQTVQDKGLEVLASRCRV